jgi:hypothetical protein
MTYEGWGKGRKGIRKRDSRFYDIGDMVVVRRRPPAILYHLLFNLHGQTSHVELFSYSSMLNPLDSRNFTMVEALIG